MKKKSKRKYKPYKYVLVLDDVTKQQLMELTEASGFIRAAYVRHLIRAQYKRFKVTGNALSETEIVTNPADHETDIKPE